MKLSEAIRLGAMLKPQDYVYLEDQGRTCALGAACDALDILNGDWPDVSFHQLFLRYPFLHGEAHCPACSRLRSAWRRWREEEYDLEDVIIHLNDDHKWTRERIANWVETIEPAIHEALVTPDMVTAS